MAYSEMFLLAIITFLPLVFICYFFHNKNGLPTNWPFIGMLLPILWNLNRIQEYLTEILEANHGPFLFEGPWFSSMRMLITSDPGDVHYVMSKNFSNFPKGSEFKRIFSVLGDGIFNADGDLWQFQRQIAHSFIGHDRFRHFLMKTVRQKTEEGLIPILDHAVENGQVLDLQDLFKRLTLDSICFFLTGRDPGCLSIQLEDIPFSKALDGVEEALFFRHCVPESVWQLFRLLNIGEERKMRKGWKILDKFVYELIEKKKKDMQKVMDSTTPGASREDEAVDLMTLYMSGDGNTNKYSDKFFRDTILNLVIAGRDTTSATLSWLFWLLCNNPDVESKIVDEVKHISKSWQRQRSAASNIDLEDISKMVYLHATLCETLRLYPPVAIEHKTPLTPDVLPSGYKVDPDMKILFLMYAMGRTESIWGEDCSEFKPSRWISQQGKLRHEPSYKFFSFNAGPRTCIGKEIAFIQMKTVVSSLIGRYRFQVVNEHEVVPDQMSIILHMKHGMKVRVFKKCD
ncbi:hypothetical protein Droror1_Dr00005241 [Drosera rotundifolia]